MVIKNDFVAANIPYMDYNGIYINQTPIKINSLCRRSHFSHPDLMLFEAVGLTYCWMM